jgi:lysyl-tRNA synthetase class 2
MTETPDPRPFWHPDKHADRRGFLVARGRIKAAIRRWFAEQDFVEVEPGCLQVSPGNEAHLQAFQTTLRSEAGTTETRYLHTSPEFAMKKLLTAGERRIFAFSPVFRNGERGPLHAPEFTMLEWYRADQGYYDVMRDCMGLMGCAVDVTGREEWSWRGRTARVRERRDTPMSEAFRNACQIDLYDLIGPGGVDLGAMRRAAAGIGVRVAADDTWSDLFSRVLAERIEPRLGEGCAEFLDNYPTHEAALARPCLADPRFAERFELYVCGVELANGFGELTDIDEQRRRFEAEMDEKERVYGERYPIDEDFLAALGGMPDASGCALGFDRLVMLATGATHIDQVLWTPMA